MLRGKNILVTGGLGFIGSRLVSELKKDNNVEIADIKMNSIESVLSSMVFQEQSLVTYLITHSNSLSLISSNTCLTPSKLCLLSIFTSSIHCLRVFLNFPLKHLINFYVYIILMIIPL